MAKTSVNNKTVGNGDYLSFEDKIADLDRRIEQVRGDGSNKRTDKTAELRKLQKEKVEHLKQCYANLTAWQTVQVSRHPKRPILNDYLELMVKDFQPMHGDRRFGDDKAIITGLGHIGRQKVLIVGQNKGKSMRQKIACNFGCPNPEGYRKAIVKMKFAEKFNIPIVTFIDTPGAYPGLGAEERGQAQAIASNLIEMSRLKVPIVCIVIGEGGSGGALGIGIGDRLAMLEFSYYSVISPEGCAAILWSDGSMAETAAEALKMTSKDLTQLGLVDEVIAEPLGGAHRNVHDTVFNVEKYVERTLRELKRMKIDELLEKRYDKIRSIGTAFSESGTKRKGDDSKQVKITTAKSVIIRKRQKQISTRV